MWKDNSRLLRYLLLFACGWATIVFINYFYNTIALFAVAGIFAALLNYPVVWLNRYMARWLAITLTFVGAIALLVGIVALLGSEILNQGQGLLTQLRDLLNQPDRLPFPADSLSQLNLSKILDTLQSGLATGLSLIRIIFSSIFTGIFGAVISLYMLIDGGKLWQAFLKFIPHQSRDRFDRIFRQSFLGFMRGQLLLMLFLSSTTAIAFPLLGVNYALLLAVILGLIDAIPGIGATLGVTLVIFLVLAAQGTETAIKVAIVCIALVQIQDNIIRPKVMGDELDINPVILFLALFIGQRVAGLLGIFLSIPIAGMIIAWMRPVEVEANPTLPKDSLENLPS
ncbi:MAG: AI-2E family transporter [Leptolyngbyaceae cyanobacterium bins.302]|nr:AI-2E family transporter [Leptolyngbyaceae cyanobacterium bins.302]